MASKFNQNDDELNEQHEINVTPFIDVMLVLLIIFMVAAPLATVSMKVDLPASTAEPQPKPDKPMILSITSHHEFILNETPVHKSKLITALNVLANNNRDTRLFIRADKTVNYETLMKTMDTLRDAGYLKIALVAMETGGDRGTQ